MHYMHTYHVNTLYATHRPHTHITRHTLHTHTHQTHTQLILWRFFSRVDCLISTPFSRNSYLSVLPAINNQVDHHVLLDLMRKVPQARCCPRPVWCFLLEEVTVVSGCSWEGMHVLVWKQSASHSIGALESAVPVPGFQSMESSTLEYSSKW